MKKPQKLFNLYLTYHRWAFFDNHSISSYSTINHPLTGELWWKLGHSTVQRKGKSALIEYRLSFSFIFKVIRLSLYLYKFEFAYLRRSSIIKHTLTTTIIIANASDATNCPIAAAGIGCNGHGSMKLARHALNIQTTVRKK